MGAVTPVTDATFAAEVLRSPKPVVVDFWAEWCTSCRRVDTMINTLATTDFAETVSFRKMDIDANPKVPNDYQVMTVPTVIVFKNGQPVGVMAGAKPRSELVQLIESAF
jgi:thioredoxin 1